MKRDITLSEKLNGRYTYVVFTLREGSDGKLIRPISARFMHKKEIDNYENQTKT